MLVWEINFGLNLLLYGMDFSGIGLQTPEWSLSVLHNARSICGVSRPISVIVSCRTVT